MTDNFTDIRPNALIMLNGDLFEYFLKNTYVTQVSVFLVLTHAPHQPAQHKSVHPMYKSFPNQLQPAALCTLRSS